jgi:predicted dienelactone hydrolase
MSDRTVPHGGASFARRRGAARGRRLVTAGVAGAAILGWLDGAAARAGGIGVAEFEFVDPSRGERPVPVLVWYPAVYSGFGAPVDPDPPHGFPLVVFGHAYLTEPEAYAWLRDGLVPAGWIVALPRTESGFPADQAALAADLRFTRDALLAMSADPASLFHGRVAPGVALGGHSLGGGAATLAASGGGPALALFSLALLDARNPRVCREARAVSGPALVLAGELDCVTPPAEHQVPVWDALGSAYKALATVAGAGHCAFAAPDPDCEAAEAACPPAAVGPAAQQELTLALLRPFLAWCLRGDQPAERLFRARLDSLAASADVREAWAPAAAIPEADPAPVLTLTSRGPHPSGSAAGLAFELAQPSRVALSIHDAAGRLVRRLADGEFAAGRHEVAWDGRDAGGRPAPAGVYLARAATPNGARSCKIAMIR